MTSVHPGTGTLGGSTETTSAVAAERALVPGLTVTSYACIDIAGAQRHRHLPVRATGSRSPSGPPSSRSCHVLSAFGPITFTTASSAKIQ